MISNPLDHRLVPALKALRIEAGKGGAALSKFREVRNRVPDAEVGRVLDDVLSELTRPTEAKTRLQPASALGALRCLRDRGFPEVQAFIFDSWK